MSWNFIQGTSFSSAPGSSMVAGPLTLTARDLIVVTVVAVYGGATLAPTSVTDTLGNTYTLIIWGIDSVYLTGTNVALYYCQNCLGGTTSITAALSQSQSSGSIIVQEYSGMALTGCLDASGSNFTGFGSPSITMTTTLVDELVIGVALTAATGATAASNMTDRSHGSIGSGIFGEYEVTPAGITTFTLAAASASHAAVAASFLIAASSPPPIGPIYTPGGGDIAARNAALFPVLMARMRIAAAYNESNKEE